MPVIFRSETEADYDAMGKVTGAGQSQAWDGSRLLVKPHGAFTITIVNTNTVQASAQFPVIGTSVTAFRYRVHYDWTELTMGIGESFHSCQIKTDVSAPVSNIVPRRDGAGVYNMLCQSYNDAGAIVGNTTIDYPRALRWFEVLVTRASTNVSSNGTFTYYVDTLDTPVATHTGIDNYDNFAKIDIIKFGGVSDTGPIDAGTSGNIYIGKILIRNDAQPIGPFVQPGSFPALGGGGSGLGTDSYVRIG